MGGNCPEEKCPDTISDNKKMQFKIFQKTAVKHGDYLHDLSKISTKRCGYIELLPAINS